MKTRELFYSFVSCIVLTIGFLLFIPFRTAQATMCDFGQGSGTVTISSSCVIAKDATVGTNDGDIIINADVTMDDGSKIIFNQGRELRPNATIWKSTGLVRPVITKGILSGWSGGSNGLGQHGHSAVVYQNKMYVVTGHAEGSTFPRDLNIYNFDQDIWEFIPLTLADIGGEDHTSVFYHHPTRGPELYVFGGHNGGDGGSIEPKKGLLIYNFSNRLWSRGAKAPLGLTRHTAVVYNDKMYVYGGLYDDPLSGAITNYPKLLAYDFIGDSWSVANDGIPGWAFNNHTAVVHGDKMYIVGGRTDEGEISDHLIKYSFTANRWDRDAIIQEARLRRHTAVVYNNKMFIFGGIQADGGLSKRVLTYDFNKEELGGSDLFPWTVGGAATADTENRRDHTAVVHGDKMFIFGGAIRFSGPGQFSKDLRIYNLKFGP